MSTLTLPDDVLAWVEAAAGAPVLRADRIPGGGVRQGWFLDVGAPGEVRELFLRYSPEALPERSAFHRLATEAEAVRALGKAGVPVPAVHPQQAVTGRPHAPGSRRRPGGAGRAPAAWWRTGRSRSRDLPDRPRRSESAADDDPLRSGHRVL